MPVRSGVTREMLAGMAAPADLALFRFAETPEVVWSQLIDGGVRPCEAPSWDAARDVQA